MYSCVALDRVEYIAWWTPTPTGTRTHVNIAIVLYVIV